MEFHKPLPLSVTMEPLPLSVTMETRAVEQVSLLTGCVQIHSLVPKTPPSL